MVAAKRPTETPLPDRPAPRLESRIDNTTECTHTKTWLELHSAASVDKGDLIVEDSNTQGRS